MECVNATGIYYLAYVTLVGFQRPGSPSGAVVRQTDSDATIGQCAVSDRNLAGSFLVRHKTLSADGEVKVCLLQ